MKLMKPIALSLLLGMSISVCAQPRSTMRPQKLSPVVQAMYDESKNNSQLENLAHELLDGVGPRLVGTPQMEQANNWAVSKLKSWGVEARNEAYGTWVAWERGITHVDMIAPRIKTIDAMQLAWSPATKKPITGDVIAMPLFNSKDEFTAWLPKVKGKIVLMSMMQQFGRSDYQYKEFATPELYEKITKEKAAATAAWNKSISISGYSSNTLPELFENNGAIAVVISNWTGIMGANRIFGAKTKKIPMLDFSVEDYGILYRLAANGKAPTLTINTQSKSNGLAKSYNTIGEIKGTEKPHEYILLSAHLDSWDGGQGATDNGTGTLAMMEAIRLIKKHYPNNKRTILICLWNGEEQGLNGSRAFVADHPEIIKNMQALFNQDNGTGRVVNVSGSGFEKSYDFMSKWISGVPSDVSRHIETSYPGTPSSGGTDHASFVTAGAPGFGLGALGWGYFNYTWHTNKDTYDKIVFDEVRNNAILIASLAYMASEDAEMIDKTKRVMPLGPDGKPMIWPSPQAPARTSDAYFINK